MNTLRQTKQISSNFFGDTAKNYVDNLHDTVAVAIVSRIDPNFPKKKIKFHKIFDSNQANNSIILRSRVWHHILRAT